MPIGDLSRCSNLRRSTLLDYFVGNGKHSGWKREAKRPGSIEVQYQLKFGGLFDRQLRWFCALEDFLYEA